MLGVDKMHHVVYSFALAIAGAFLIGPTTGIAFALLIGAGKELWWDWHLGRGEPDWWDMAANCIGILAAVWIIRGWGV